MSRLPAKPPTAELHRIVRGVRRAALPRGAAARGRRSARPSRPRRAGSRARAALGPASVARTASALPAPAVSTTIARAARSSGSVNVTRSGGGFLPRTATTSRSRSSSTRIVGEQRGGVAVLAEPEQGEVEQRDVGVAGRHRRAQLALVGRGGRGRVAVAGALDAVDDRPRARRAGSAASSVSRTSSALLSGSSSGTQRSSPNHRCTSRQSSISRGSSSYVRAGVLPPASATCATPRCARASSIAAADPLGARARRGLRVLRRPSARSSRRHPAEQRRERRRVAGRRRVEHPSAAANARAGFGAATGARSAIVSPSACSASAWMPVRSGCSGGSSAIVDRRRRRRAARRRASRAARGVSRSTVQPARAAIQPASSSALACCGAHERSSTRSTRSQQPQRRRVVEARGDVAAPAREPQPRDVADALDVERGGARERGRAAPRRSRRPSRARSRGRARRADPARGSRACPAATARSAGRRRAAGARASRRARAARRRRPAAPCRGSGRRRPRRSRSCSRSRRARRAATRRARARRSCATDGGRRGRRAAPRAPPGRRRPPARRAG